MLTETVQPIFLELDAAQTMEIVRELRRLGLIQGIDFDFKYLKAKHDIYHYAEISPRGAEFYLREGKWRTYFTLKYAS